MRTKATNRFSGTVENYVKYRVGFPAELIDFLATKCGLAPDSVVADLGSGTGILTKMLLDNKNTVFAVEPNAEMRSAAERMLGRHPRFRSINATAEETTLADASVDLVTVGRAMHWFDAPAAMNEMSRILKPDGVAVVVWNRPREPVSQPLAAYRELLRIYCADLLPKNRRRSEAVNILLRSGFNVELIDFAHRLDLKQLKGQVLSLSISPNKGDPNYRPLINGLGLLFAEYQVDGLVTFEYSTTAYYGRPPRQY